MTGYVPVFSLFCGMVNYWVHTPQWLKRIFPGQLTWDMPATGAPTVYLTFDDGPHPVATPFVMEQMRKCNGKATFFCVGNNVKLYPYLYQQLLSEGHTTGNHTYNHMNGWKVNNATFYSNIAAAAELIETRIFRPPYGRIKLSHVKKLTGETLPWKIYMWDIICGDFDPNITPEQCTKNVLDYIRPGSIVVFHDSAKALERMQYALPRVIAYCVEKGWKLAALPK